MRQPSSQRRRAFTLLEIVLAMAIGMLLMIGLYVALDIQFGNTQAGREIVEQSKLARSLLTRIDTDISQELAPISQNTLAILNGPGLGVGSGSGTSGAAGTAGTAMTSGTSSTSSTSNSTGSASGTSSTSGTNSGGIGTLVFNLGVQGDSTTLQLFVSRLPRDVTGGLNPNDPSVVQPSDLRRITYWLAGDAGNPLGLARQEVKFVTSNDEISVMPPDVPDSESFVFAPEVKSLEFEYFDGSNWQTTWDGTQPGSDGVTPQGPPAAIAITVTIARPGTGGKNQEDPNPRQYRHVVAIPTANNMNPQFLSNYNSGTNSSTQGTTTTGQ